MPTSSPSERGVVVLDRRFAKAVEWACSLHREQMKKGKDMKFFLT